MNKNLKSLNPKNFAPVMKPDAPLQAVDLSTGDYPGAIMNRQWLVGGYMENRKGMYSSDLYGGRRFIHLGIDIWAAQGSPVFAIADGKILGVADNANELDYGPTVVTEHEINGVTLYCLYGHLSRASIVSLSEGDSIQKGDQLATLGSSAENGGWLPHLHFQISLERPEKPDMPGVCSPDEVETCRLTYPDPRLVLGPLY